jgi:hypothetical protein
VNIYKKYLVYKNKHTLVDKFPVSLDLESESASKKQSRKMLLDHFQSKITHKPINPSSSQPENVEQQSAEDFLGYVQWLSKEGCKKYYVELQKDLKIKPRS